MNLTLHQLEVFEAVARNGSISKAAEQLFLDQSTVSIHIRQMEKSLNLELITYVNKKLEITPAGLVLLDGAQKISTILSRTSEELSQLLGGVRGRLRIGVRWPLLTYLLPPLIKELKLRIPNAELEIVTGPGIDFPHMLSSRELDLAITHNPPVGKSFFCVSFFFFDRLLLVARPETLEMDPGLTNTPLVARAPDIASRRVIDTWLQEQGVAFREIVERPNIETIKHDVTRKSVVGVVSQYTVAEELADGQLVVVAESPSDKPPGRNFYFVHHRDSSGPLLNHFMELAREMLPPFLSSQSSSL